MKRQYKIRIMCAILFVGIIGAFQFFHLGQYVNLSYINHYQIPVKIFIQQHYLMAVCFYMIFYIGVVVCMLPLTLLLNIASGYFFGVIPGTIYSVLSATTGALLSLLIFRYLMKDFMMHKYEKILRRFQENFRKNGIFYLLSLQLFPMTPFPVVNICAALSNISLLTFVGVTALGITPGTIVYTWAGKEMGSIHSVHEIVSWPIILLFVLLSVMSLIPPLLRKLKILPYNM